MPEKLAFFESSISSLEIRLRACVAATAAKPPVRFRTLLAKVLAFLFLERAVFATNFSQNLCAVAETQDHSYCGHMTRNITLSVEDSVLKEVRRIAVEQDTTVNGLVRRYLHELAGEKKKRAKARRNLLKLLPKMRARVGRIRWTREELHAR